MYDYVSYISLTCRFSLSLPLPGNFPMISDDLVNSYHLLLCALDLVFSNALLCNTRKELLNPNFKGALPAHAYIPSVGLYPLRRPTSPS